MAIFEWILNAVVVVGTAWMLAMMAYYIYLSVYGFKREGRTYEKHAPKTRFLILVPAHNEEAVIGDMVRSLQGLDYPDALYDFYIIADNCEDDTAGIARSLGGKVIETRKAGPDAPTGKPIALQKALQALPDYDKAYDLLMIFDADNLMDRNILSEVNSQYISEGKPEIIQCYLGTKNREGIVAMFDHMSFAISNRFMNMAKYNMGLNAAVGGTGFAVETAYLASRGGWTTESLTEDFEMQMDVALHGGRILWNHNVRIYDEKPTNVIASYNQRVRWAQGRWFVAFRNTGKLFSAWFHKRISFAEMLSLFTHMYSMATPIFAALTMIASGLLLIMPLLYGNAVSAAIAAAQLAVEAGRGQSRLVSQLLSLLSSALMLGYSFFLLYWRAEKVDNGGGLRWRDLPMIAACYVVNIINVSLAQFVGLFKHKQQSKWVKTSHKISERQRVGASQRAG